MIDTGREEVNRLANKLKEVEQREKREKDALAKKTHTLEQVLAVLVLELFFRCVSMLADWCGFATTHLTFASEP